MPLVQAASKLMDTTDFYSTTEKNNSKGELVIVGALFAGVPTGVTLWKWVLRPLQMLDTELPCGPATLFLGIPKT